MTDDDRFQYIRGFGRVVDRADECVVNPNFNNWCSKHKMRTCDNHKPLHCNVIGDLVSCSTARTVHYDSTTIHLSPGKKYCSECIGNMDRIPIGFFKVNFTGLKKTKIELIEMAKEMDPPNEALVEQVNNFYK